MTRRIGVVLAAMCVWSAAAAAQDRMVMTGCLQLGDALVGRSATAAPEPFVLVDATREPVSPSPVGTSGRTPTMKEMMPLTYAVDGKVKDLAKRVGRRVEIIGKISPATTTEFLRVNVSDVRSLGTCR
jgi:multidrug efflux pump subunit AcrA (membrane-fusion protein)